MQKTASLFFLSLLFLPILSLASEKLIVALGDSLTEGYGVAKEQAYPALLEKKLKSAHKNYRIINAGVSGSTTAGAVARLKWQLKSKPDYLLLALGANDGLRGLKVSESKKNLSEVIELARASNVQVILCGMLLPPNYGESYRKEFQKMFDELSQKYKPIYIPFLLEGVAGKVSLNLNDGIHPNEKGYQVIADTLFKVLNKELP